MSSTETNVLLKLSNSLPVYLRQTDFDFEQSKRHIKTFLFGSQDFGALSLTAKLSIIVNTVHWSAFC